MPRFDNEQEFLEKLRDDGKNFKLWSEFVNGKLQNTCYEIINGMVILTPSYHNTHSLLTSELAYQFHQKNINDNLVGYLSNFDIKIDDDNFYIAKGVICNPTNVKGNDTFITGPIIIFEILTDKNINAKFEHYQKLESLQEYVLIDLNSPQIWVYRRENGWQTDCLTIDDDLYLKSVDYSVKVADIYDDIEFE